MADIVFKSTRLPDAIIGVPYEASIAITGNATAVTAMTFSPSLPSGLAASADFVRIVGTPTLAAKGLWTGKITLTDTAGAVQSANYTLNVRFSDDADEASLISLGLKLSADEGRKWPH